MVAGVLEFVGLFVGRFAEWGYFKLGEGIRFNSLLVV